MKKLILGLIGLGSGACQQSAPQVAEVSERVVSVGGINAPTDTSASPLKLKSSFSANDTLTKSMRDFLRGHDLANLWQRNIEGWRERPVLDGFFGPDHLRFSLVFTQVERDKTQPEVYHVQGKCRYKQNVRSFTGSLTIRQLADLSDDYTLQPVNFDYHLYRPSNDSISADSVQTLYEKAVSEISTFTARARLQLTEEKSENSGVFEGEALLDFGLEPPNFLSYVTSPAQGFFTDTPTRGSGFLIRGERFNTTTNQVKTFIASGDVFSVAKDFYKDFGIGDRGMQMNPKYKKQGWIDWENEEWWAEPGKPSLNL